MSENHAGCAVLGRDFVFLWTEVAPTEVIVGSSASAQRLEVFHVDSNRQATTVISLFEFPPRINILLSLLYRYKPEIVHRKQCCNVLSREDP